MEHSHLQSVVYSKSSENWNVEILSSMLHIKISMSILTITVSLNLDSYPIIYLLSVNCYYCMHCTLLTILMAVCQQLLKCGRGWGSSQVLAGQDGHHVTRADVLPLLGQVPRTGEDLIHTPMGKKCLPFDNHVLRSSRN